MMPASQIGHNGGPSLDARRKVVRISLPISVSSLTKHAWGAAQQAAKLNEKELVKAWSYRYGAVALWRCGVVVPACFRVFV